MTASHPERRQRNAPAAYSRIRPKPDFRVFNQGRPVEYKLRASSDPGARSRICNVAFAAAPLGLRDAAVCSGGLTSNSEPFHWLGSLPSETKTLARVLTEPPAPEPLEITMIYWFVLFATIILFPAIAEAQVQTGTTLPPLLIPLEPPETFPPSGTEGGYLFNLRPLGADFGRTLADHGIYIIARNLSDEIANVSGGVKRGMSFQGFTELGFDLDMDRIAGIPGGAVHFLLDDLAGQPFYAWSGSAYFNNRLFAGDGPAFRVNELSYEQKPVRPAGQPASGPASRLYAVRRLRTLLHVHYQPLPARRPPIRSTGATRPISRHRGPRSRRSGSPARSTPISAFTRTNRSPPPPTTAVFPARTGG